MLGTYNKLKNTRGLTLIEALVSVVIVGIGFISIFQMVNYSVRSIDVSGERTKSNFLVAMVAEDLMADKDQEIGGKKFIQHLLSNSNKGWKMGGCSTGFIGIFFIGFFLSSIFVESKSIFFLSVKNYV